MILSTTHTRMLANSFANAFACGTGKCALLATHHSIPVVQFFAILSSLIACFNMVLLLHVTATLGRTLAGFFASASACGTGKRALFATHHPILVAQFSASLPSLVACLKWAMLVHVAARWAVRALALTLTFGFVGLLIGST